MPWSAAQYGRFRDERTRPFLDLLARVPERAFGRIADLGCGTGDLTAALAGRWPVARVTGVDSSPDMIAAAAGRAVPGRLDFVRADLATWQPDVPLDLVVSNAALHWLPDHDAVLGHLAALLAPGAGVLALQMPANFAAPSHVLLEETAATGPWAGALAAWRPNAVWPLHRYVERLWALGFAAVDAWETTYLHVLPGDDPVLEWVKGTTLRPVLGLLGGDQRAAFLAAYGAALRRAYPKGAGGTLFPFRRIFLVAGRDGT